MPAKPPPAFVPPKTLAACADMLYSTQIERLKIAKEVAKLEDKEKALKAHIIANLPKSEATGVAGKLARVQITSKFVPSVTDWPAFYAHIKKTNGFDMLQRRPAEKAIQDRWDAKKAVPGIEPFNVLGVSVTKVG